MQMQRFLAASVLAFAAVATSNAQAHAKLVAAEPKADSTLSTAPKEIRLKFNEALEGAFSKIKLTDAGNTVVALPAAKVDAADGTTMSAALPALRAGRYRVQWATVTHDGHKTKGEYSFNIK